MYVKLSDTVFTFSGHLKWGKPVERPPVIPDGFLPTQEPGYVRDQRAWEQAWKDLALEKKCHGLRCIEFDMNGLKREAWICATYMDHDLIGSHGDAYARIVNGVWSTLDNEPELDLAWGRKGYRDEYHTALEFNETVMAWGFNSSMTNTIPTSRFIELTCMGRGIGDRAWANHCAELLHLIDVEPTESPVEKAAVTFSKTKHMGSLLAVMAHVSSMTPDGQRKHYLKRYHQQWNQRTRSTSTIY